MSTPYEDGYERGQLRREDSTYDPRHDFADAAKAGVFAEFKRGFTDGYDGKVPSARDMENVEDDDPAWATEAQG